MEQGTRPNFVSVCAKYMKSGMYPFSWLFNRFLANFRSTTSEEKSRLEDPCYERYLILSFSLPFYLICIILYALVGAICFIVWIALQSGQPSHRIRSQSVVPEKKLKWSSEKTFQITSINTYLMPEYSARYYNLGHTQERTEKIIDALIDPGGASKEQGIDNIAMQYDSDSELEYRIDQDTPTKNVSVDTLHKISAQFTKDLDVICFQGVFEFRAQRKLVEGLRIKFPYIVSDCEVNSWSTNRFRWPSGLVVASRWPIEDACFKAFTSSCAWDKNISKGILIAKVRLDSVTDKNVCYIINTHLQEGYGQDAVAIRDKQLKELQEFIESYCKENHPGVTVLFSILCGQLGFDNKSSGVRSNWSHELLCKCIDPCRSSPGCDHNWSIGTQMIQHKIHKESVATPDSLKRCLEERQEHSNYLESCQIATEEEDDASGRGRKRVNYILVKQQSVVDEETQHQVVKNLTYTTAPAGLTLNIPIVLSLKDL